MSDLFRTVQEEGSTSTFTLGLGQLSLNQSSAQGRGYPWLLAIVDNSQVDCCPEQSLQEESQKQPVRQQEALTEEQLLLPMLPTNRSTNKNVSKRRSNFRVEIVLPLLPEYHSFDRLAAIASSIRQSGQESMSTMPAVLSGQQWAKSCAIYPPAEWPATTNGLFLSLSAWLMASTRYLRSTPLRDDLPKPNLSQEQDSQPLFANYSCRWIKCIPVPPPPCSSRIVPLLPPFYVQNIRRVPLSTVTKFPIIRSLLQAASNTKFNTTSALIITTTTFITF